mgnify:CR=1 FL=1
MSRWDRLAYHGNIKRLQARRTRQQLMFSQVKMSGQQWYDLILAETEDVEQAEKALQTYIAVELRAGRTPVV